MAMPTNLEFTIQTHQKDSNARLGRLSISKNGSNAVLNTPALVLGTQFGSIPFLTRDLLEELQKVELGAMQILAHDSSIVDSDMPCREWLKIPSHVIAIISPTPLIQPATQIGSSSFVSVDTIEGRKQMTNQAYIEKARTTQPDILIGLHYDSNETKGKKRFNENAHKRSLKWLDHHLLSNQNIPIFGVLLGGNEIRSRAFCSSQMAKRKNISGVMVGNLHDCGGVEHLKLSIEASLSEVPNSLPRSVQIIQNPLEVLASIDSGVDLVHNNWPYMLTKDRKAFVANILMPKEFPQSNSEMPSSDVEVINLLDEKFKKDLNRICTFCNCSTCSKHSKAYIHHLLKVNEITGNILLMVHNVHHYLKFFIEIRSSIENGEFKKYFDWWLSCYKV